MKITPETYLASSERLDHDMRVASKLLRILQPAITGSLHVVGKHLGEDPIFEQKRIGKNGETIVVPKIKTLKDVQAGPIETHGTHDPRATRFTQMIRKIGIDECLQLQLVAEGTMSFVGARPLVEHDIDRLESIDSALFDDWYAGYTENTPGLFGLSQYYRKGQRQMNDEVYRLSMLLDLEYWNELASPENDARIIRMAPREIVQPIIGIAA